MAHSLSLSILSPVETILEVTDVDSVRVHVKGDVWLSIYPGHAPLLAEILPGKLFYTKNETQTEIAINTGILRVFRNEVTMFSSIKRDSNEIRDSGHEKQFDSLARKLLSTLENHDSKRVDSKEKL